MKKSNKEIAAELFGNYSKQNEVHFTSDGTAFFEKHFARTHAATLEDSNIETLSRSDVKVEAPVVEFVPKALADLRKAYKKELGADADESLDEEALKLAIAGVKEAKTATARLNGLRAAFKKVTGKDADQALDADALQKAIDEAKAAKSKAKATADAKPADQTGTEGK